MLSRYSTPTAGIRTAVAAVCQASLRNTCAADRLIALGLRSASMLDLPDPEDSFDERLLADIRDVGWHCVLVADEHHPKHAAENAALGRHSVYDATFVYSVGLSLTRHHAELILVGRWQHAHAIIASAVDLLDEDSVSDRRDDGSDTRRLRRVLPRRVCGSA